MATRIAVMNGGVIQQFGSPDEIYERPANLFVAGFIGAPAMNLKRARHRQGRRQGAGGLRLGPALRPRRLPLRRPPGRRRRGGRRHAARAFRGAGNGAAGAAAVFDLPLRYTERTGSDATGYLDFKVASCRCGSSRGSRRTSSPGSGSRSASRAARPTSSTPVRGCGCDARGSFAPGTDPAAAVRIGRRDAGLNSPGSPPRPAAPARPPTARAHLFRRCPRAARDAMPARMTAAAGFATTTDPRRAGARGRGGRSDRLGIGRARPRHCLRADRLADRRDVREVCRAGRAGGAPDGDRTRDGGEADGRELRAAPAADARAPAAVLAAAGARIDGSPAEW